MHSPEDSEILTRVAERLQPRTAEAMVPPDEVPSQVISAFLKYTGHVLVNDGQDTFLVESCVGDSSIGRLAISLDPRFQRRAKVIKFPKGWSIQCYPTIVNEELVLAQTKNGAIDFSMLAREGLEVHSPSISSQQVVAMKRKR